MLVSEWGVDVYVCVVRVVDVFFFFLKVRGWRGGRGRDLSSVVLTALVPTLIL